MAFKKGFQRDYTRTNTCGGDILTTGSNTAGIFTSPSTPNIPIGGMCSCGAMYKLAEVMRVNQSWQKDYTSLIEEKNFYKVKLETTEERMEIINQENLKLRNRLQQLENQSTLETDSPSPPISITSTSTAPYYSVDDIEALKQQLLIYKDDFEQEKEDHVKLKDAHSLMKLELGKTKEIIEKLERRNNTIKENYRRVSTEKENIIAQLKKITGPSSNAAAPAYSPWTRNSAGSHNEEDFILYSGKTSPVNFYGGNVERDGV